MPLEFSRYAKRERRTVPVREGYALWAETYDATVPSPADYGLLERVNAVPWDRVRTAADLACGTGRTGAWLLAHGVGVVDGVDCTPEMLVRAANTGIYRGLELGNLHHCSFPAHAYDLVTCVFAACHLPGLGRLYSEEAHLAQPEDRKSVV